MKYVEVVASAGSAETVTAIAEKVHAKDFRLGAENDDGMRAMRLLVNDEKLQSVLDMLQNILGAQPTARITVIAVETALPKSEKTKPGRNDSSSTTREALYEGVSKGAHADFNYFLLVALSTVVAAIGLIESNVAVLIGAMVIAPLLAPNLALILGTALGDISLMRNAVLTLLEGVLLAALISVAIGAFWPSDLTASMELMARTDAGLDSVALALASGAAAALSLSTGLPSVLVGVMVAVALLPPAAAAGLMLGQGHPMLALGATLLLAINIACVNLSGKIVFFARKIGPRTWVEKEKAKGAMKIYIAVWLVTLVALILVVFARRYYAV